MKLLVLAMLACSACATSARPAELVALPAAPPPGPWAVMREALDGCAQNYQLAGDLRMRLDLDRYGKVIMISSQYGDGFAGCVGNAVFSSRYRAYAGRAIMLAFRPTGN